MKKADDLMVVTIELEFRARKKPAGDHDVPPLPDRSWAAVRPAEEETADLLEEIAEAIRERRLFGYMAQQIADAPVETEEWIEDETP